MGTVLVVRRDIVGGGRHGVAVCAGRDTRNLVRASFLGLYLRIAAGSVGLGWEMAGGSEEGNESCNALSSSRSISFLLLFGRLLVAPSSLGDRPP